MLAFPIIVKNTIYFKKLENLLVFNCLLHWGNIIELSVKSLHQANHDKNIKQCYI